MAVDGDHHVIVAIDVGNQASDAGYGSSLNLEECKERALDAYISTNRQRDGKDQGPSRKRAPRTLTPGALGIASSAQ